MGTRPALATRSRPCSIPRNRIRGLRSPAWRVSWGRVTAVLAPVVMVVPALGTPRAPSSLCPCFRSVWAAGLEGRHVSRSLLQALTAEGFPPWEKLAG